MHSKNECITLRGRVAALRLLSLSISADSICAYSCGEQLHHGFHLAQQGGGECALLLERSSSGLSRIGQIVLVLLCCFVGLPCSSSLARVLRLLDQLGSAARMQLLQLMHALRHLSQLSLETRNLAALLCVLLLGLLQLLRQYGSTPAIDVKRRRRQRGVRVAAHSFATVHSANKQTPQK